jgi:hypothetical protein
MSRIIFLITWLAPQEQYIVLSACYGVPEMIEAGMQAYYRNSGDRWSNPGDVELCAMIRNVFLAMSSTLPKTAKADETIHPPLS